MVLLRRRFRRDNGQRVLLDGAGHARGAGADLVLIGHAKTEGGWRWRNGAEMADLIFKIVPRAEWAKLTRRL